jgi:hypothetical protein
MRKRKSGTECEPFKRGERGYVKFPCPQCKHELQTQINYPGWCECPRCGREIFWREAKMIAVRVMAGKCAVCGEPVRPGDNICGDCLEKFRVLQEQVESSKAENAALSEALEKVCEAADRRKLGDRILQTAARFRQDIRHWKFVVLILAIETIRLGIEISRLGR